MKKQMFNAPHPGEILLEDYMKPLGLTVDDMIEMLEETGVTFGFVSRKSAVVSFLCGGASVDKDLAEALADIFNTTSDFWINLQAEYDKSKIA